MFSLQVFALKDKLLADVLQGAEGTLVVCWWCNCERSDIVVLDGTLVEGGTSGGEVGFGPCFVYDWRMLALLGGGGVKHQSSRQS